MEDLPYVMWEQSFQEIDSVFSFLPTCDCVILTLRVKIKISVEKCKHLKRFIKTKQHILPTFFTNMFQPFKGHLHDIFVTN